MIKPHPFATILRRAIISALVILCGVAEAGQLHAQTQEITKTRIWPKTGVPLTPVNDTLVLHWNALGYACMSYGTVTTMDMGFDLQDLSASASMDLKVVVNVTAKLNSDLCNYSSGADADSAFTLTYSIGRRIHGVAQAPSISPDVNLSRALDGQDHQTFSCRRAWSLTFKLISVQRNLGSGWVSLTTLPAGVQFDAQLQWSLIPALDFHAPHFVSQSALDCNNGNGHPDELLAAWSSVQGAYAYDLEWTWVDDYKSTGLTGAPTSSLTYDLLHDATRVSVSEPATHYRIPLLFDHGHLVMRVRAVGRDPGTGLSVYGDWSLANSTGTVATAHTANALNTYAVSTAHEPQLNWQLTSTFAEEGKHKEVMTYADGTLRSREVVTRNNSLDVPIIGETFYDAVGRAAVESMPVPLVRDKGCPTVDGHAWAPVELYTGFNKAAGPTEYTYTKMVLTGNECAASSTPFDPADGAELYYNAAHMGVVNALTGKPSFLPLANGYPFTQTEFTRDNTGRIRKKSGVGDAFKLGSGHESEFLYGKPEQIKLDRLFGSEAGYAAHYQKNVVIDGNGQASVSYVDHAGHTVATALAGGVPSGMDAISPYATPQSAPSYVTDMFGGQSNLECEQNVLDPTVPALVFTDQFVVPANDLAYSFAYTLATPVVTSSCLDVCLTCVYDLSIQVIDQCGTVVLHSAYPQIGNFQQGTGENTTLLFAACGPPGQMQTQTLAPLGPVTLDIGEYTLIKTLQVHAAARDAYVAGILADGQDHLSANCFTPLDDLEQQYQAAVDTMNCYIDCADCYAALGTVDDFVLGGHGTAAEYQMLLQQCDDLCNEDSWCTVAYQTMLADMSLDGQYATVDYDDGGSLIVPDRASVFYFSNGQNSTLGQRTNQWDGATVFGYTDHGSISGVPVDLTRPLWRQPRFRLDDGTYSNEYLDEYGDRSTVTVTLVDGSSVPPVYDPPVVNTASDWVFPSDIDEGVLVTYPENLQNLSDFLPNMLPGFERSLVIYHPEYCYWLDCKGYDEKSAPADNKTSDEFDNWLRAESFVDAQTDRLINTAATLPTDRVRVFVNTGNDATDPVSYDPFGANASVYGTYATQFQSKFNAYLTYPGFPPLSMVQAAAIFTRCGPYPNSYPTDPHCSDFGKNGSFYVGGVGGYATPQAVYDAEWATFKSLFLAEKYRYQKQLADSKVMACGECSGVNYCIGQGDDHNWRSRLDQPLNNLPNPSWYSGLSPAGQVAVTLALQYYSCPVHMGCQACSDATSSYYANKAPRFPEPTQFPGMNTSAGNMAYQNYAATGDCPLASAWLALFAELANGHHLAPLTPMNLATTSAWSGVMVAQNGATAAIPGGTWTVTTSTSTLLTVAVTPTGGSTCTITFANAGSIPDPWNSIFTAVAIDAHPGGTFDLHVDYFDAAGVAQAGVLNGTICSTYNLVTCSFPMVGTSNELGDALQQLMSLLATSPSTADVLSSSTFVNLSTPLWSIPTPPAPSYQSEAPVYFANQFGIGAIWKWKWVSSTQTFQLTSNGTTGYPRYSIKVLSVINPQAGFTLASSLPAIYSFENLHSTGANLFDVDAHGVGPGFAFMATLHCQITFDQDATHSQGLPAGTYGYPPSAACAGFAPSSEYNMMQDLYNLAVDFFHATGEGYPYDLFASPFMTDQLRAVLAPLQCPDWVAPDGPCPAFASAGLSPYYDPYRMWHFGNAYCFTINILQNNPGPETIFSAPVPYGEPDENGLYNAMAFYQLSSTGEPLYPDSPIIIRVDCLDLAFCDDCGTPPCDPVIMPPPTPVVAAPSDGCVDMLMTNALNNAHHAYQDEVDQLTLDLTNTYNDQCMHALETLAMTYQDPEYHYTLYYYDQAGNLVKTIPPEGVEPLDIGSVPVSPTEQATIDAISADRENGTHNVLTAHRMPSEYVFNSLNSPIRQNMPDMDRMDIWDLNVPSGLPSDLRITSSVFQGGGRGFLCGWRLAPDNVTTRGYVYSTSNGGATWGRSYGLVAADLANATFFNSTTGYAVGRSGTLLKTIDGGNSWDLIPKPTTLGKDFLDVAFKNATNGVAICSGNGYAWITSDGGATTGTGTATANFGQLTSIKWLSPNYWVSAYTPDNKNGMLGYGTGNTFTQLTSLGATSTIMNTVCSYAATAGFAGGDVGVLMRTTDTGASWSTIKTGTTDDFKIVRFMDASNGLALVKPPGGNVGLRHTSDGGLTWVPIGDPAWDFRDLYMYSAGNPAGMIAVGTNGTVVRLAMSSAGTVATIPMPSITGQTLTSVWATVWTTTTITNGLLTLCGTADGKLYWTSNLSDADFTAWGAAVSPVIFTGNADVSGIAAKVSGTNVNVLFRSDGGILNAAFLNTSNGIWTVRTQGSSNVYKAMTPALGNAAAYISATHSVVDFFNLTLVPTTAEPYYNQTLTLPTNGPDASVSMNALTVMGTSTAVAVGTSGATGAVYSLQMITSPAWTDRSWRVRPLPILDIAEDDQVAVGVQGTVLYPTGYNSVNQWIAVPTRVLADLHGVANLGSHVLVAVGDNGTAFTISPSAPTSFSPIVLASAPQLNDVVVKSGAVTIAADGGTIFYSATPLVPGSFTSTTSGGNINGLALNPGGEVFAVGDKALVNRMFGGLRANVTEVFTPRLNDISMADAMDGYVVGNNLVVRHTVDGGQSWNLVPLPSTETFSLMFNAVATHGPGHALVAGNSSLLATITGDVYSTGTAGTGINWQDIATSASGASVVAGLNGTLGEIATRPATGSWSTPTSYANFPLYAVWSWAPYGGNEDFLVAGHLGKQYRVRYASGLFSTTALSTIPPSGATADILGLFFHDQIAGYAVGTGGKIYRTLQSNPLDHTTLDWATTPLDNGAALQSQTGSLITARTIGFSDRHHGFVGGDYNTSTASYARTIHDESQLYSNRFWYDELGRLILSQNTKQFNYTNKQYSYSLYDNLGRVVEAGVINDTPKTFHTILGLNVNGLVDPDRIAYANFQSWIQASTLRNEVVRTYYDKPMTVIVGVTPVPIAGLSAVFSTGSQDNLRLRVADVTYAAQFHSDGTYDQASHYSYDIHGNVKELVQDDKTMSTDVGSDQQFKDLRYSYDLISGNVRQVDYQTGKPDQFHHRYSYDADNRIDHVETSRSGVLWREDARYFYYPHGPLERVELGDIKVQGLDYAYTLQGWLKSINSDLLLPKNDMGQDALVGKVNALVGRDVYGLSLGYYGNGSTSLDYAPIDNTRWSTIANRPIAASISSILGGNWYALYNGNIASTVNSLAPFGGYHTQVDELGQALAMAYRYDQLNRLDKAVGQIGLTTSNDWKNAVDPVSLRYQSTYGYDANGNILNTQRWDQFGVRYDNMVYAYQTQNSELLRNRLYNVKETADPSNTIVNQTADGFEDYPYQPTAAVHLSDGTPNANTDNNYGYDAIGNLVRDNINGIQDVQWSASGKVQIVKRTGAVTEIDLDYGPTGERRIKKVNHSGGTYTKDYYVHDAQGNIMAVYHYDPLAASLKVTDHPIYGSKRLGVDRLGLEMLGHPPYDPLVDPLGQVNYELTDHLGNVATTVTDELIPTQTANKDPYFQPNIVTAQGYEPFGGLLPGRNYSSSNYRFGFQGQEKDDEVYGTTGTNYAFEYRMHDPRVGRFWSIDPLAAKYAYNSPYAFSENRVIDGVELEGLEVFLVNGWDGLSNKTKSRDNADDLSKMNSYWTKNNPSFVMDMMNYFGQSKSIFMDGSQGGLTHGSVITRYTNGYAKAIEMMNSGEIDVCLAQGNITFIGHSQGGAYAAGMAQAVQERVNEKDAGIKVNLVLLSPDGAEQFRVLPQLNTVQLTFGDDGVVTDRNATVGNVDVDLNPKRDLNNPYRSWSLGRALEAHSATVDTDKLKIYLEQDEQAKILYDKCE